MNKPSLVLIGGGGHCSSIIDVLRLQNIYNLIGVLDTMISKDSMVQGVPVLGGDELLLQLRAQCNYALICVGHIGSSDVRIKLYNQVTQIGYVLPIVVSPLAYVAPSASIGSGTVVHHGAIVNVNATIGHNCIINSRSLIEHDAVIHDHCHIATGAIINGNVTVGGGSFVGSNVTTKQGAHISAYSFIKAGSVVK